ncbi:hypothetical protein [Umezawaea tangerina]|uniref:Uncharacterized protein n=1 Tax=Umezawaea tangerina TaxID=84725 RepID=A0A2T0T3U3_9PSEU|nr:hypothetical protein [Umezawaea tangerina]PRY40355.1 hypothetical protein CLV43_10689 [Umezawaea tangerina]
MAQRKLLVWLHVLGPVGWMSQALALFALTTYGLGATGPTRASAFEMANVIDTAVLQVMATTSAYTGFMLSALTSWGYFRHWWVLAKFVITLSQLYLGIFLLSPNLDLGEQGNPILMRLGSLLMAAALATQVWLSVAKPGKRTPWTPPGKFPSAPGWVIGASAAVPLIDYVLLRGIPAVSLLVAIAYPMWRRWKVTPRQSATSTGPRRLKGGIDLTHHQN